MVGGKVMVCEKCGSLIKLLENTCSICGGQADFNNRIKEDVNIEEENSSQDVCEITDVDEQYNMHFFESNNWQNVDRSDSSIKNLEDSNDVITDKAIVEELGTNEYEVNIEEKTQSKNGAYSYEYYELLESKDESLKSREIKELYWQNNNNNSINDVVEVDEDIKNFNPEKIRKEQEEFKIKHRNDKKINTSLNIYFYVTVGILLILMLVIDEILEVRGKFIAKPVLIFGLILEFLVIKVKDSIIKDKMFNAYLYLIISLIISFIILYFVVRIIGSIRSGI